MTGKRPQDRVLSVYARHGSDWARLRGDRPAEGDWIDRFCALIPPGGEVLDLGCGSGLPIARGLAGRGFAVTGVDGTAEMLALFRHNLPGLPAILADMRDLALGRNFAGILAWDSFFHLSPDDQRDMFDRLRSHALPGAPLMFTSGTGLGSAIGLLGGEPLYHGSLSEAEYRDRLKETGFEIVDHVVADPACDRTVWLARASGSPHSLAA